MSNKGLQPLVVPVSNGLSIVDDPSKLLLLLLCQVNIPGRPILREATGLRRARNSNHPLGCNPR